MAEKAAQRTTSAMQEAVQSPQQAAEQVNQLYDDWLTLSRENMERMGSASLSMMNGLASVGSGWASTWAEQTALSLETTQKLAGCRTLGDMAAVQSEFTRACLERMCSEVARSANLTAETLSESLGPIEELSKKTIERVSREAA